MSCDCSVSALMQEQHNLARAVFVSPCFCLEDAWNPASPARSIASPLHLKSGSVARLGTVLRPGVLCPAVHTADISMVVGTVPWVMRADCRWRRSDGGRSSQCSGRGSSRLYGDLSGLSDLILVCSAVRHPACRTLSARAGRWTRSAI